MSTTEVIHLLRAGLPLCGFSNDIPANWPEGNSFVSVDEAAGATCHKCKVVLALERDTQQAPLQGTTQLAFR